MTNKLFVGGLSWDTSDEGLRQAFGRFGEVVDAKVLTDRETGRSRGFGFVTMGAADAAANAMRELDGSTLDGRAIRVNEANDRPGGGGGGRGGGGGGGGGRDRDRDDRGGGGGRGRSGGGGGGGGRFGGGRY